MIISYHNLSSEALHGVIEEFITKDGTDYGLIEATLNRKINDVIHQDDLEHWRSRSRWKL